LTGFAPTVVNPKTISVPAGALTLTGYAPLVLTPRNVSVPAGALTLTGLAPTVATTANVTIAVPTGSLTLTGFAPTVIGSGIIPERRSTGAGRAKPRRRYLVEVDGQDRAVDSPEQARAVLAEIREQAEEAAETALQRAAKAERRKPRKILQDARRLLVVPQITVEGDPALQSIAANVEQDIRALYESTLKAIEIGALMRRRQQQEDEDDEDVILLSL
jgi:hypothetical protein